MMNIEMSSTVLHDVLEKYGIEDDASHALPFGSGLINHTWKIFGANEYILQRINTNVFKEPGKIAHNIRQIANFLQLNHPAYIFISPLFAVNREDMIHIKESGYFRLFPFVPGSVTKQIVENCDQAFEAAKQFAKFTRVLNNFDQTKLQYTIPDFHNLPLRYHHFLQAINTADDVRKKESTQAIQKVISYEYLVKQFTAYTASVFQLRVMHHDTKISNVLFDRNEKGICIIDLDTVMPGYFFSDVGDMIRTYISAANEEETDMSNIEIRADFFKSIVEGYLSEMGDLLTKTEKNSFLFAGKVIIYMQAVRFLTDYLKNDIYYGAKYPAHNLNRALNQLELLVRFEKLA